jgi:hypothetical protein
MDKLDKYEVPKGDAVVFPRPAQNDDSSGDFLGTAPNEGEV